MAGEHLAQTVDLKERKEVWSTSVKEAEDLFDRLPADDVGCLYLNAKGNPIAPDPSAADFDLLKRHFGSVRGAWPQLS